MEILVLGFYKRFNLGDDMFRDVLPKLLPDFECIFECIDDLNPNDIITKGYRAIIIGCGDVINDYFLDRIIPQLKIYSNRQMGMVIAFGVGIPDQGEIWKYYDLFDHVFLREKRDLSLWSRLIGAKYVHYLPDIGFRLSKAPQVDGRSGVGVFLARPMRDSSGYKTKVISTLRDLVKQDKVTLYSFNTSDNPEERDLDFNLEIASHFNGSNLMVDCNSYTPDQIINIMSTLHYAVCSRFHSHVFAIVAGCPFISLATTRKVELLLEDSGLRSDDPDTERIKVVRDRNHKLLLTSQLNNLIWSKSTRSRSDNQDRVYSEIREMILHFGRFDLDYSSGTLTEEIPSAVATELCYSLTGAPNSKYLYGTIENFSSKIDKDKVRGMIEWINKDQIGTSLKSEFKLDMTIFNQNTLEGFHRAGWPYVTTYLKTLQTSTGDHL